MGTAKTDTIYAKGQKIQIYTRDFKNDYISLTDIALYKSDAPSDVIKNWLRRKDTIEFLGLWESLNNPDFNSVEFDLIKSQAGYNSFTLSPKKWIETTGAIGIVAKGGRYGGAFAHSDIALEFASWISAEFKMYIIQDYKRLKYDQNSKLSLSWNLHREIAKLNYRIHTEAIKENLLPPQLTSSQTNYIYADEADMLNVVLFGMTAKEWHNTHRENGQNIRDCATIKQLLVLANLESYNALLIEKKIGQKERMLELRNLAQTQLIALEKIDDNQLRRIGR